jgi:hypothetical protein
VGQVCCKELQLNSQLASWCPVDRGSFCLLHGLLVHALVSSQSQGVLHVIAWTPGRRFAAASETNCRLL